MGSTTLLPLSSHNCCPKNVGLALKPTALRSGRGAIRFAGIRAAGKKKQSGTEDEDEGEVKISKQSLLNSIADALDLSQTRSSQDARLIEEAKEATKSGGKMNMEQYGALRRKIGGTYKDFFKTYVEVEGQYVEEGWVDKTCKICKRDTKGEPRQVDKLGRYIHVSCLGDSKSGNLFSKLFSR